MSEEQEPYGEEAEAPRAMTLAEAHAAATQQLSEDRRDLAMILGDLSGTLEPDNLIGMAECLSSIARNMHMAAQIDMAMSLQATNARIAELEQEIRDRETKPSGE